MYLNKLIRVAAVPMSLSILLEGQLSYLNQYYKVIGVSSEGGELSLVQTREKIEVKAISIERKISVFKDVRSLWKLYRYFKREKPFIVHSITPKAGLLSMIASRLAGVPIRSHTFTGLIFPSKSGLLQSVLIMMDKLLCFCATNIYPEGEGVRNDLLKFKITNKPLKIIANGNVNGINTSFFDPTLYTHDQRLATRQELNINEEDFVFIFIGRLVSDKGINELVDAFDELSHKYAHIKLLLVGSMEPDLDPLQEDTINSIETNHSIISAGYQSDVRPYLAISDALTFPSYREGFPNVVMQAGAMGLPSIVTNINGSNEIIVEGENGTIIPIKDTRSLTEKMELWITDKKLLSELRSNARQMITSRYEQKIVWEALLKEYQSLERKNKNE